jgi:hypothetical protein
MGSTKVQAPPPRDYYKEMTDTITAQIDMAPLLLENERKLVPQWQNLQMEQMRSQADNLKTFYGEVMDPFAKLAGDYANSMGKYAMEPLGVSTRKAYESSLGGGQELQNIMRQQAVSDLNAGTSLTQEMQRMAQQASRSASTARGLTNSNLGIADEVLNSYNLGLQRQNLARTFATTVLGNDMSISGNAYNQYGSPMMAGMMQGFSPTGIATSALGLNQTLGPQYLKPESQYASNIYQSNYNADLQARVATAQNNAGVIGGAMSMFGNIAKGYGGK